MGIIRVILVPVEDSHMASALNVACRLAISFHAHVIGLHIQDDPATMIPLIGEGMSSGMIEEMMKTIEQQGEIQTTNSRELFENLRQKYKLEIYETPPSLDGEKISLPNQATAQWLVITGQEEDLITHHSRLADLVVMSRPAKSLDPSFQIILNAVLMESGKPLLLAPPIPTATVGENIAIAWNGSAEAARAVSSSLPLLVKAEKVSILTAPEKTKRAKVTQAKELAQYLAWHGVQADEEIIETSGDAGPALLSACQELQSDLLVMGAYTHSRLRQLILGGVTQHILSHAEITCLLRH